MRTECVIIGAGHSGLAMSYCLTERSVHHVVLERGEVANSWKTERWEEELLYSHSLSCECPA